MPEHLRERGPESEGSAPPRTPARHRIWRALVRPTRRQLIVGGLLAVLGFAAVTQVRTNTVDDTYAGLRQQDLIDILDDVANETQRAQAEIQRLEAARDDLLSETSARQAALEAARNEADTYAIIAGTVPVTGPGLRITIKEVSGQIRVEPFIDLFPPSPPPARRPSRSTARSGSSRRRRSRTPTGECSSTAGVSRRRTSSTSSAAPRRSVRRCGSPMARRSSSPRTTRPS